VANYIVFLPVQYGTSCHRQRERRIGLIKMTDAVVYNVSLSCFIFIAHYLIKITKVVTKNCMTIQLSCLGLGLMVLTTMNVMSWAIHYHSLHGYEGYWA